MTAGDKSRCPWPGDDPLYVAYHDREWGVPEHDGRALFEKLVLDGFQAGLSWITILRKRDNFLRAFDNFEPQVMARYGAKKVAMLMADTGIVRNRAKIEGAIASARAYLEILDGGHSFDRYIWHFTEGRTMINAWKSLAEIPAHTTESRAMSADLKARGFRFCGPTVCYAFMQAVGMVNDHIVDCFRYAEVQGHASRRSRTSRRS